MRVGLIIPLGLLCAAPTGALREVEQAALLSDDEKDNANHSVEVKFEPLVSGAAGRHAGSCDWFNCDEWRGPAKCTDLGCACLEEEGWSMIGGKCFPSKTLCNPDVCPSGYCRPHYTDALLEQITKNNKHSYRFVPKACYNVGVKSQNEPVWTASSEEEKPKSNVAETLLCQAGVAVKNECLARELGKVEWSWNPA